MALEQQKACKILHDGEVNGTPLTESQRKYMGAICSGQAPRRAEDGTVVVEPRLNFALMEVLAEDPHFLERLETE